MKTIFIILMLILSNTVLAASYNEDTAGGTRSTRTYHAGDKVRVVEGFYKNCKGIVMKSVGWDHAVGGGGIAAGWQYGLSKVTCSDIAVKGTLWVGDINLKRLK